MGLGFYSSVYGIHYSQQHLLQKIFFLHWVFLSPMSNIIWLCMMQEFISGLFILFHSSMCLHLCQYPIALISKKIRNCNASRFVHLRTVLATYGLLWPQMNFRIVSSTSVKMLLEAQLGLHQIHRWLWYEYFNDINSYDLWTSDIIPFICVSTSLIKALKFSAYRSFSPL